MIPFVLTLLQGQAVPLVPFVDDGQTKAHPIEPILVPLKKASAVFRVGSKSYRMWLKPGPALYADRNGNGIPEPSERIQLQSRQVSPDETTAFTIYGGLVSLPGNARFDVRFVDPAVKNPKLKELQNSFMVMPLFGYVGKANFGGKTMRFGIRGGDPQTATMFIDRDGDGTLGTVPAEMFALSRPFNIGGTTYKLASLEGGSHPSARFVISSQKVAEVLMPPNLNVGRIAPALSSKTLAGKKVVFPKGFPGKIVLLDVWATWCAPCRAEIPFIKAAYAKFRKRGFEVVSFNIDDPGMGKKVASFIKAYGTNWTQAVEGRGWQSSVCRRYNITGIPFMLLADGTTGKILATEFSLRGPNMAETIEGVLAMRGR